ncbi:hypothetical protein HYS93_02085 [Candidatus Daviesbacteria bacterium]|nr:hypothetical protein [Candidatus Daviesbacteria bacterium]
MAAENPTSIKYPVWGGYISTDPFSFGVVFYQAIEGLLPISLTRISDSTISVGMDTGETRRRVSQVRMAVWTSFRGLVVHAVEIGDYHSLYLLERRDYEQYYDYLPQPHIIDDRLAVKLEKDSDPPSSITLNRSLVRAYQRHVESGNSYGVLIPKTCLSTTKAQHLKQLGYPPADPGELVSMISDAIGRTRLV